MWIGRTHDSYVILKNKPYAAHIRISGQMVFVGKSGDRKIEAVLWLCVPLVHKYTKLRMRVGEFKNVKSIQFVK